MRIRISIQRKLGVLLLLVSLLPLNLLALMAYRSWQENLKRDIGAALHETSRQTLDLIDRLLFFAREDIRGWALTEAMQDVIAEDADGRISAMASRLKKSYGLYAAIFCTTPKGKIVASSEPGAIGADVSQTGWFQEASRQKDGVFISDLTYDPLISGFAVNFTAPIHAAFETGDKPEVIGYLSSRLNWSELFAITNEIRVNDEGQNELGYAALVDSEGYLISGPGFILAEGEEGAEEASGTPRISTVRLSNMLAAGEKALAEGKGFSVGPGPFGHTVLFGFARSGGYQEFSGLGWSMVIIQDVRDAFAPVANLRRQFLAMMGGTILIVLLLAFLVSRHFGVPIRILTQTAVAIGQGDFDQRVEINRHDELGELSSTINRMTGQLKQSRDDLISAKEYTDNILQSLSNGVLTLDLEGRITRSNRAALQILQVETVEELGDTLEEAFLPGNPWVTEIVSKVVRTGALDWVQDSALELKGGEKISVNLAAVPLRGAYDERIGTNLVLEDITEEKRVRSTMQRYMTREVADRLLDSGEAMLGGTVQVASVLFSDIRGFTTLSEQLGAQETVSLLNDYFSLMVDIIFQQEGILDKYIGDAILAVFGVPFKGESDADNAVEAGIDMVRALKGFNRERQMRGEFPIGVGIGINTDNVVAGNIGSLRRMDYTVIGDGVNFASRLEGVNKFYKTQMLVSDFTRQQLKKEFLLREVDRIRVKGKENPVAVYQVLDHFTREELPEPEKLIAEFGAALAEYRARNWDRAIERFAAILEWQNDDDLARLYIDRCQALKEEPPPEDWGGVWTLTEK